MPQNRLNEIDDWMDQEIRAAAKNGYSKVSLAIDPDMINYIANIYVQRGFKVIVDSENGGLLKVRWVE